MKDGCLARCAPIQPSCLIATAIRQGGRSTSAPGCSRRGAAEVQFEEPKVCFSGLSEPILVNMGEALYGVLFLKAIGLARLDYILLLPCQAGVGLRVSCSTLIPSGS